MQTLLWPHVNNTTIVRYTNEYKWVDELNMPFFLYIWITIKPQHVILKHGRLSNIFLLYIHHWQFVFDFTLYRSFFDFHHRGRYCYYTLSCYFYWFISADFVWFAHLTQFINTDTYIHIECYAVSDLHRFFFVWIKFFWSAKNSNKKVMK